MGLFLNDEHWINDFVQCDYNGSGMVVQAISEHFLSKCQCRLDK